MGMIADAYKRTLAKHVASFAHMVLDEFLEQHDKDKAELPPEVATLANTIVDFERPELLSNQTVAERPFGFGMDEQHREYFEGTEN